MALPASGALLAKMLEEGDAIFSTRLGTYPPRQATPPFAPIIIRSDPVGDQHEMIADLWKKYPQQCKAISAPVTNIYQYFDHYDVMLKGQGFLYAVLLEIAVSNAIRAAKVHQFAANWRFSHLERFLSIGPQTQDVFTDEEKELYEEDFLKDVFTQLQSLRVAIPVKGSQHLESTSGSPVLDTTSLDARNDHTMPVRTISQPLPSSNYGALMQAKRYASAPQPPPYAVPLGPARPLPQRLHSDHRSNSGQPLTTPANIGYFSTPQSPVTGGFLNGGHDAWNREAPKHTFHPDVPETMRLRPHAPQAEVTSSHWKHPDLPMQEQLHPIREGRGHKTTQFRRPRGGPSPNPSHQNIARDFGKLATRTPHFFDSIVPTPQPGSNNLTNLTGYPQDRNSAVTLGHPGTAGHVPFHISQPSHFVRREYPRNQQNLAIENQSLTSAPQSHGAYWQRGRRGSTSVKRGRMHFSNDARVLEQQDAYRRQEGSIESNPYEVARSGLPLQPPLQPPRQDSVAQPAYHSSLERNNAAPVGPVSYSEGLLIDAERSAQSSGPSDYAGYILKDSREGGDFDTADSINRRQGHQSSPGNVALGGNVGSQEEKARFTGGCGSLSDTDGKSHTHSTHENKALVTKHLQATPVDASNPNVAYNGLGGQGDFLQPQDVNSAANWRHVSLWPNRLEQRPRAVGGQNFSPYNPNDPRVTRIWVGNLPLQVGKAEVRALFEQCGMIADVRIVYPRVENSMTYAFVTFENNDAAAKALNSPEEMYLGAHRLWVYVAYKQPIDDADGPYHGFAESPVISRRSYIPGESTTRMQLMDGSMDISPESLCFFPEYTAHGIKSQAVHRYHVDDQQHIAASKTTPKKKRHNNSIGMGSTNRSASSGKRTKRSQMHASTTGKPSGSRSSRSFSSDQQFSIVQNECQVVSALKDGIADGSPSKKKKTSNAIDVRSQGLPLHIPESSESNILWTTVENCQQESQAATDRDDLTGARHGSFDGPDSMVYPGSDSTSEATGNRVDVCTGTCTASATTQRKPNPKKFSGQPSHDQSSAAQILKKSVAGPRDIGKRQQDRHETNKHSKVGRNTSTSMCTAIDSPSMLQEGDTNVGNTLDRRIVSTNETADKILDMIQHQSSSSDNEGLSKSTTENTDDPQTEHLHIERPRDITPTKFSRQTDFRIISPNAEATARGTERPCPSQPVSIQSPATAPSKKLQVVCETPDSNTLKLRSDVCVPAPNIPKSKHETAGVLQKRYTKKPSTVMPPSRILGSGPIMAPAQRSAAIVSPPKVDDESAFPPLGSSDEDKNRQSFKPSAEVKHYDAVKHADYSIRLRAGIRTLTRREADIPGDSESGNLEVQPTDSATRTLDRKSNSAVLGRTSEHAETASANATASCNRDENTKPSKVTSTSLPLTIKDRPLILSQVALSLSDTRTGKVLPQRRRTGGLATLDLQATSPEVPGKKHTGSDSDAWALPKGERKWSVTSVI
ncbi:MAG: hypothetical protein FRX48_02259 [Lasallia pustulata]|uniref:RRM domain-containing protein n=1 Tax=Lasallia pustulata TaxID=136370 RepID=A0A5M8PW95_9LECA|nr:MAG: hypothetical protein FRX48_02259 [Lasallia pustulata]